MLFGIRDLNQELVTLFALDDDEVSALRVQAGLQGLNLSDWVSTLLRTHTRLHFQAGSACPDTAVLQVLTMAGTAPATGPEEAALEISIAPETLIGLRRMDCVGQAAGQLLAYCATESSAELVGEIAASTAPEQVAVAVVVLENQMVRQMALSSG